MNTTFRPYKLIISSLLGVLLFAGVMIFFAALDDGLADRGKLLCFICSGIVGLIFLFLWIASLFCCVKVDDEKIAVCLGIYSNCKKYRGFKRHEIRYEEIQSIAISYSPNLSIEINLKSHDIELRALHYGEKTIKQMYSVLNEQLAKNRSKNI